MNNKVHKIDSSIINANGGRAVQSTYGPATSGMEWDLANGGGLMCNVSATIGRMKFPPKVSKVVTGLANGAATAIFAVTVPNATLNATFEIDVLGIEGAGGAVGQGEAIRLSKYQVTVVRFVGLATVFTVSAAIGGAEAHVAGADTLASVVVTASGLAGANSATQTFNINVAISRTGGSGTNHIAVAQCEYQHQWISGILVS